MAIAIRDHYPGHLPVPTNEWGVVIPPPVLECIGEDCRFRGEEEACELTQHHLHSTEGEYERNGRVAYGFRKLLILTAWLPRCQHEIHHEEHEIEVPIPDEEVMREARRDSRRFRRLDSNTAEIMITAKGLAQPDISRKETFGLLNRRETAQEERELLLQAIGHIEVIPAELITGALLKMAPEVARRRIEEGSGYALTGTTPKDRIPGILEFLADLKSGQEIPLQTGVDRLQLVTH